MKRLQIKAISRESKEWVRGYGYLDFSSGDMFVTTAEEDAIVIPETICRSTGITINTAESNGLDFVYEHDIVLLADKHNEWMIGEVTCDNLCFYIRTINEDGTQERIYPVYQLINDNYNFLGVLGNTLDKEYHTKDDEKPIIFCISGKARHGKDTFAKILAEYLGYFKKNVLITHYGDLLKYICESFHKWDGQKDEQGRHILQHTGTELVRKKDPDYWTRFMREQLEFSYGIWDAIIIPDCRYLNEMGYNFSDDKFIAYNIRVERPNFDNGLTEEQKNHSSETELDNFAFFDYTYGASDLIELASNVSSLVWNIVVKKEKPIFDTQK